MTPPIDDPETLRRVLAGTEALLLDFDGPICSVFAGIPAPAVADQLRGILAEGGHTDLPADVRAAADPFEVLFYAAKLGQDEVRYVEAAFRAHEVEAVQSAQPTPGTADLMCAWKARGLPLAVVSNNSTAAVETYVDIHGMREDINFVSARTGADIALLKPSPFLVTEAANRLSVAYNRCTLVGDSATDIQAALAAHIRSIGFANKSGKGRRLSAEGADVVIARMDRLLAAVQP